jgi:uracil-DNA glycosylase
MTIEKIAEQVKKCRACRLCEERTNAVPGVGNPRAKVVFIGEGPGKDEDKQGEPFVGAAGKFLNEMIKSVGWERKDVFITNVVKCRPPENRDPQEDEIETCTSLYLWNQLELINPILVATLGRHSMYKFLPSTVKISQVHGTPMQIVNKKTGKKFNILPLYHPAAALYNGSMRATLLADFQKIPKLLESLKK